ncbi:MAG: DUF2071 domain-containing protein [Cytophagales bacterium]|nr:DUF2071 domain-containing protein [Armatimonadota bacterium]
MSDAETGAAPDPTATPAPTPDANVPTGLFARLRDRLEAPEKGAATITGTLRDYLVVTWAVLADTVRPHVPQDLPLDVLPGADGALTAFLQVVAFYGENVHWSPLKNDPLAQSYHQVTYRVLTRYQNKRGSFAMRSYFSAEDARNAQRVIARESDFARFFVYINGDPARETYTNYHLRAVGDRGQTSVEVRFAAEGETDKTPPIPAPFAKFEDMTLFLTQREESYFAASAPKNGIGRSPVRHEMLTPRLGTLGAARASLFTDLRLLTPDDLLRPIAVLLQPSFTLTTYPPRLAKFAD